MKETEFEKHLHMFGEVGTVSAVFENLVKVEGLPNVLYSEIVLFESGGYGQVFSLESEWVEVLLLSKDPVGVDVRVARTGQMLSIAVDDALLGKVISSLPALIQLDAPKEVQKHLVDIAPSGMETRAAITRPFTTGVRVVDLLIPLGRGQRELVIGDRKTGKTQFLLQVALAQAREGAIVIYGAVAKRRQDVKTIQDFFVQNKVEKSTIIITSFADDAAGIIFLTPYIAMTMAEHFRDEGRDVVVILDDLTAHAKFYREISLTARRFPGRNSYPGDIFYVHSRLLERAGQFKKGSITTIPVAEAILGDLSGYIQTNTMAMTDGHIFFDHELSNQGRRPSINIFLSVTRVGLQAQTPLLRDISRTLNSFLLEDTRLRQFLHFGAELSPITRQKIALGDQIYSFLQQQDLDVFPLAPNVIVLALVWMGYWKGRNSADLMKEIKRVIGTISTNQTLLAHIESMLAGIASFPDLIKKITAEQAYFVGLLQTKPPVKP